MTVKQMSLELMLINLVEEELRGEGRFIPPTQIRCVQNPVSASDVLLKFTWV